MPLETGSYIGDLVSTNPVSSDTVGAGDDHLRLIKSTLKATFPFMGGPAWRQRVVSASTTITASTENMTHFITTDNVNLNLPDGATAGNGWMGVIFPAVAGTTVHLVPAGTDSINAVTATASVQHGTVGLLFGTGGVWYLHKVPRYDGNSLSVPGGATISGSVVMGGTLAVAGAVSISGNVVMNSGLYVAGAGGITVSAGVICANIEIQAGATSFIDFKNSILDDFDVRLVLTSDDVLEITTGNASASGLTLDSYAVYNRGNANGTVSQSGGIPTGALIEYGSNASGEYARFANNVQICWRTVATGQYTPTSHGHAAAFSAAPKVNITVDAIVSMLVSSVAVDATSFQIQPALTHDGLTLTSTVNATMRCVAVGPWF